MLDYILVLANQVCAVDFKTKDMSQNRKTINFMKRKYSITTQRSKNLTQRFGNLSFEDGSWHNGIDF